VQARVVAAANGMDAIERLLENANIEILVTDLNTATNLSSGRPRPAPDCK